MLLFLKPTGPCHNILYVISKPSQTTTVSRMNLLASIVVFLLHMRTNGSGYLSGASSADR